MSELTYEEVLSDREALCSALDALKKAMKIQTESYVVCAKERDALQARIAVLEKVMEAAETIATEIDTERGHYNLGTHASNEILKEALEAARSGDERHKSNTSIYLPARASQQYAVP